MPVLGAEAELCQSNSATLSRELVESTRSDYSICQTLSPRFGIRPGRLGINAASKSEFLIRHRTFHVGHAQVTDSLFEIDGFFDPRDLLQVKYERLRHVRVDGGPVGRAAREASLSRTAWYDAMHRWETGGLMGLLPVLSGPRPNNAHVRTDTDGPQKRGLISKAIATSWGRGIRDTKPSETRGSLTA